MHYGISPQSYPNMTAKVAWVTGPVIEAIQRPRSAFYHAQADGAVRNLSQLSRCCGPAVRLGFVAAPIFPMAVPDAKSADVCFSIDHWSAHYLVDLLAGSAIGLLFARPLQIPFA